MIFYYAFQGGAYFLLGAAILGVILSIYYYFGWIRAIWFVHEGHDDDSHIAKTSLAFSKPSCCGKSVLIIFAGLSLLLGFLPLILLNWW